MTTRILVAETDAYPRNGEGSICGVADDHLIFCFTRFHGGTDDDDEASVWMCESQDRGRTWSTPALLLENRGARNTMSVSLLPLYGRVLMAVLVKDSPGRSRLQCFELHHQRISDPQMLSSFATTGYLGFHNDRLRLLSDGRLALPVSTCEHSGPRRSGGSKSLDYAFPRTTALLFSEDAGRSWHLDDHRVGMPKRGAMEPCVTEYQPGCLLLTFRTQLGFIYGARFTSGQWSDPYSLGVSSPEAPHTIVRGSRSGLLYLVHCPNFVPDVHHFGPRYPLVIRSSPDGGATWSTPLTIADGDDGTYEYANTSLLCTEGELLLTYYRRHLSHTRYNSKDVMMTRIATSEIPRQ